MGPSGYGQAVVGLSGYAQAAVGLSGSFSLRQRNN